MPLGTPASFRGTLTANPAIRPGTFQGTLAGFVEPGFVDPGFISSYPMQTFTGVLSRARIDAWDAELTYAGVRIVLAGQEVPQADLVGLVGHRESIDTHLTSATLRLAGAAYSIHRTETTWTRTPVEVYFRQRAAGGAPQEVLRLEGVVRTCREVDHEGEPVLEVTLADLSAVYDRYRLCHETAPYSGLTRGQIAREVCLDAGIPATDIPEGERYDAPVQLDGVTLFEFLHQWGEPEGWHWRWEGDTLTAYVPTLKQSPQAPDHVWTPREIETLESDPPEDVPSRWSVRGFAALYVDEIGIETELTRSELRELYAPAGAIERQDAAGNRNPVDFAQQAAMRLVQVIVEELKRRGTRELQRSTREWGWYNIAAAKGITVAGLPGTSGLGWDYTQAYIDTEGRFVVYPVERFGEVGYRFEVPTYDGQGNRVAAVERVWRHRRRTQGVRSTGSGEGDPTVDGAGIGDDDQSYFTVFGPIGIEEYGQAEVFYRTFGYHQGTGAALREQQEEWGYHSPRHALDVAGGFRLYDGSAQADLVANLIHVRTRTKLNLLASDGRLRGVVETASGYAALQKHDGARDYGGGFGSNETTEVFRALQRKNILYIVKGKNQVEEVTYENGERHARLILGGLPIPGFLSSPWVELVQEPLELVIDDPVIEQWFGISQETIDNPYIQNEAEALRVYRNRRARALAKKLTIGRAETLGRPGDTVLVLWPPLIAERYLLVEADTSRDPLTGRCEANYRLEHPL